LTKNDISDALRRALKTVYWVYQDAKMGHFEERSLRTNRNLLFLFNLDRTASSLVKAVLVHKINEFLIWLIYLKSLKIKHKQSKNNKPIKDLLCPGTQITALQI
jgi:hypothetical protein